MAPAGWVWGSQRQGVGSLGCPSRSIAFPFTTVSDTLIFEMRPLASTACLLLLAVPCRAIGAPREAADVRNAVAPKDLLRQPNGPVALKPPAQPPLHREHGSIMTRSTWLHYRGGEGQPMSQRRDVRKALQLRLDVVVRQAAYISALAAHAGRQLWAGRAALAALLVRFRLTAFTSEIGESFRPLVPLWKVQAAYAVSWLYVSIDVLLRTCDEWAVRGRTLRVLRTFVFFSVFHTVATMLFPAILIHQAVHHAEHLVQYLVGRFWRVVPSPQKVRQLVLTFVPTLIGIALIPVCPVFDHPIEHFLESLFSRLWPESPDSKHQSERTDYEAVASPDVPGGSGTATSDAQTPPPSPPAPSREQSELQEEPGLQSATGREEPVSDELVVDTTSPP
jgi:fission process protein 1